MEDQSSGVTRCSRRWVQVNNTVVPVVQRATSSGQTLSYIPLPVVKHGAGLFPDHDPDAVKSTPSECQLLSDLCLEAGFRFDFPPDTELILLDEITKRYRGDVYVAKLPDRDPFVHAEFWPPHGRSGLSGTIDDSPKSLVPEGDSAKRHGFVADKDNDDKTSGAIWRPVSFSPDQEKYKTSDVSSDSGDCLDKPLDLSLRGKRTKRESTEDGSSLRRINSRRSHSRTTKNSHKHDRRQSPHFQERQLFGQPILTMENNNKEYVSLSCLRQTFFPTIPSYVFPSIVAAVEGRVTDADGPVKGGRNHETTVDRLPPTDDKMIEFGEAERILIGVGAFVQAMVNSQLMEPSFINGYWLPLTPCPVLYPDLRAAFRAGVLPSDALSMASVIADPLPGLTAGNRLPPLAAVDRLPGLTADRFPALTTDRIPGGAKQLGIPEVRDRTVTSWNMGDFGLASEVGKMSQRAETTTEKS